MMKLLAGLVNYEKPNEPVLHLKAGKSQKLCETEH